MCKSHTKKIGALKLSQQDVGKNCIFRGCEERKKSKRKGKEGEQGNKWEGREKGKGEREKGKGKERKQPSSHLSSFIFLLPNNWTRKIGEREKK